MSERPPRHTVRLRIDCPTPDDFPDQTSLAQGLSKALDATLSRLGLTENLPTSELSVLISSDAAIRALNRDHRGIDKPTDVLSFSLLAGDEKDEPPGECMGPVLLGDIVLGLDTISEQARSGGMGLGERLCECFVHGLLHLLGWDHEAEEDRLRMERTEDDLFPGAWSALQGAFGAGA